MDLMFGAAVKVGITEVPRELHPPGRIQRCSPCHLSEKINIFTHYEVFHLPEMVLVVSRPFSAAV